MDGVLSQEEISALLSDDAGASSGEGSDLLTPDEIDAIGEISNISMGTAATTLFSLVNRKVEISTPVVTFATWDDIVEEYERPCVFIRISYTTGLDGSNLLVLREQDVKIITDLMMGGDGTNTEEPLGEIHLSAICEAMNQMMGSSATSLSSMLNKMIDISPPSANLVDLKDTVDGTEIDEFLGGQFVKVSFLMEIGDLVSSTIMQLYPASFAKEMCAGVADTMEADSSAVAAGTQAEPQPEPQMQQPQMQPQMQQPQMQMQPQMQQQMPMMGMGMPMYQQQPVNAQPVQFQAFAGDFNPITQQENMGLIMDVPLDVTVELGRTSKSIQDILEFAPGTIIELNKIAGEPIDVLVNGKYVAKGEVVVLEESFGVRITEIINN